jgi:peroxiredoxin
MAELPTATPDAPKVGAPAPEFRLQGIGGKEWSLADARGVKHVVLLFYVLDWTPG